ncbi:MAG: AAA family ATPase [Gammaproteobacteria bacterium]|nr:AAA family ATPase [Gammaproteobacteria bacterium]
MSLPSILVFFGLTASGKSTLGRLFAEHHNYVYLNTDRVRKEILGLPVTARKGAPPNEGIYSQQLTRDTYAELLLRAEQAVQSGAPGVVLDGSYMRLEDRRGVLQLATKLGLDVVFVFCDCSAATVKERLQQRARDPEAISDAGWAIYQDQLAKFSAPDELAAGQLLQINTERPPGDLLAELDNLLRR